MEVEFTLNEGYYNTRAIPIGTKTIRENNLIPGPSLIYYQKDNEPIVNYEVTINQNGTISRLTKMFYENNINVGSKLLLKIIDSKVYLKKTGDPEKQKGSREEQIATIKENVFKRKKLEYIRINHFKAENVNDWEPRTEPDVYLAFGALQDFIDYEYACGTDQSLLNKLGYKYEKEESKPDAILIEKATDKYMISEFKMNSSDFKRNHTKDNIDILVCWVNDEQEQGILPSIVIELQSIAKAKAADIFSLT